MLISLSAVDDFMMDCVSVYKCLIMDKDEKPSYRTGSSFKLASQPAREPGSQGADLVGRNVSQMGVHL